jgi:hypothetical protein
MAIEPHLVLPHIFGRGRANVVAYPAYPFNAMLAQKPKVTQCRPQRMQIGQTQHQIRQS